MTRSAAFFAVATLSATTMATGSGKAGASRQRKVGEITGSVHRDLEPNVAVPRARVGEGAA